jgi:hypothetical protein
MAKMKNKRAMMEGLMEKILWIFLFAILLVGLIWGLKRLFI